MVWLLSTSNNTHRTRLNLSHKCCNFPVQNLHRKGVAMKESSHKLLFVFWLFSFCTYCPFSFNKFSQVCPTILDKTTHLTRWRERARTCQPNSLCWSFWNSLQTAITTWASGSVASIHFPHLRRRFLVQDCVL